MGSSGGKEAANRKEDANGTESTKAGTIKEGVELRILCDGVFDLCHAGHFNAVRQCRAMGLREIARRTRNKELPLIVSPVITSDDEETLPNTYTPESERFTALHIVAGINGDDEAEAAKGCAPMLDESERAKIMEACRWVNSTDVPAPYEISLIYLNGVRCHFASHGSDLVLSASGKDCYSECREDNRLLIFNRTLGVSTTDIISKILLARNAGRERRNSEAGRKEEEREGEERERDEKEREIEENRLKAPLAFPVSLQLLDDFIGKSRRRRIAARAAARTANQGGSATDPCTGTLPAARDAVFIVGTFDLVRGYHIDLLRLAKAQGKYLIVGLQDDAAVHEKYGPHRPIMNQSIRALNLYALEMVDEVLLNPPAVLSELFVEAHDIGVFVEVVPGLSVGKANLDTVELAEAKEAEEGEEVKEVEVISRRTDEALGLNIVEVRCPADDLYERVHSLHGAKPSPKWRARKMRNSLLEGVSFDQV